MQITKILERNAQQWPNDVALVEINPQELENRKTTWREYALIESSALDAFRSEITWGEFDMKANRFANFLLSRGFKKGDKVAILLMNCLEWLPIYFGILKAGCLAVPLNFRYTADEIKYCLELADADVLALEISPERAERIRANLKRLNLKARVVQADAADTASWAGPDSRFDAVLLDAPCTASGILRRHPDVAFLRQSSDIVALAKQQKILLDALWPRVKFGGRLLYVVCSVFKEEGPMQIADFLKRHKDARAVPLADGLPATLTVLPRDSDTEDALGLARIRDGFFYALLTKG